MKGFSKLSACSIVLCCISAVLCAEKPKCTIENEELLQHPNPNYFWYCLNERSEAIELPCPSGRGFLKNNERSGCIPFEDWKCTTKTKPSCKTAEEHNKPHRHPNPNKLWVCPNSNLPAREINCAPGKGFVDHTEHLGCLQFEGSSMTEDVWVCAEAGNYERE